MTVTEIRQQLENINIQRSATYVDVNGIERSRITPSVDHELFLQECILESLLTHKLYEDYFKIDINADDDIFDDIEF